MNSIRRAAAALAALLLIVGAADSGFAQLTRGSIAGTVRDNTGAVLPGVTVTIRNNDTGITRTVVSDAAGFYRAAALEPGTYTVSAQLQGFRSIENREIPVRPTSEATFDVVLELGALTESIDVTAQTEAVTLNKTNATVGLVADSRQATLLPLGATRDLRNLALLSPNVTNSSSAGVSVGQSNIAANGQRSRNNNYMIDGTDNNDVSVTLQTLSVPPESIAEVSIQTNPYNVEFGRNSGAQFNVITKGGSNSFRGNAFDYYRDSDLNARDNLEKQAGRDEPTPFTRHQWGGGLGGPIVRNKAFFYGLFQNDRLRQTTISPTTRIPTPAGYAALRAVPLGAGQTAASRQAVLDRLSFLEQVHAQDPAYRNTQTVLVNGVAVETAQVGIERPTPRDAWYYIGRGDVQLTGSDNLTARYIRHAPEDTNLVSNTNFGSIFAGNQLIIDQNFAASHTRVLGATSLNESRFAWIRRDLSFPENDPDSPTATITGLFTVGGASNFPQSRLQDTYQFQNITTFQRGRHSLKAGADIRYIDLDNSSGFDFKGTFTFNNLQDYINNFASNFRQALQQGGVFNATQWTHAYFLQDDFRPTPNLTLNLGLRYEYNTVPLGLFGAEEQQVRDALVPGPAQDDRNNWSPRVGFAWSPAPQSGFARWLFGETTSSIRGGYGITYDVLFYNILTVNGNNYPRVVTGEVQNVQNLYPSLTQVSGAPVFSPLATFVNSPEDIQNPMSHIFSLSWQRELYRNYVVEIGYSGSRSRYGISQGQANPAVLTDAQIATVQATQNFNSIPSTQARRVFPQYGSRILIKADAEAEYDAMYVSVNRRLTRGLQMGAAYTYSATYSDGDESLALGFTTSSPQVPQDYNDLAAEWSRSAFDRPHRLVINWIYEVPWFETGWAQNAFLRTAFSGWQFSGVAQFQSGRPFTVLTGVDTNGNGAGGDRANLGNGRLVPDPVTGNFRTFTNEGRYVAFFGTNNLPLQNSMGNGNAPRNAERGPGFQYWDLSMSKRFRTIGDQALSVRADFLNAFNQDDYGNPVSNMTSPDFGSNTNNWGNRSITVGASYSF